MRVVIFLAAISVATGLLSATAAQAQGFGTNFELQDHLVVRPSGISESGFRAQRLQRAAELVHNTVAETLAYYAFPEEHWRRSDHGGDRRPCRHTLEHSTSKAHARTALLR